MAFNVESSQWLESIATAHSLIKILVFLLLWAVAWLPIAIPLARRTHWYPAKHLGEENKLPLLSSLYLVAPLVVWLAAWVEGSSFADYGLDWQQIPESLLWGISIGAGGIVAVFMLQGLLGWVQWHPENRQRLWSTVPILGLGLGVGVIEELIFRGFLINVLLENYRYWSAAAISSLIFALLHLVWNRKETLPQLPGLWVMGMVLVGARSVDAGSLGLAWGLHAGWIWGLSSLEAAKLISDTGKGATWITGLDGQPLAGAAGILCLLGTSAILWWLY